MANIFVKLGKKASSFRDQSLNLTILPGQVKELNLYQQNSRKVKAALNGGHLVITTDPKAGHEEEGAKVVKTPESLSEEFFGMVEVEKDVNKILRYFTAEQFKQIAEFNGIEVEEKDTKKDIYEALTSDDDEE